MKSPFRNERAFFMENDLYLGNTTLIQFENNENK